jgi:hypothetical protein
MSRVLTTSALFALFTLTLFGQQADGIWTAQVTDKKGKRVDESFQFHQEHNTLRGKMFGDEFDLPIENASINGDRLSFVVSTTNYYSGVKIRFAYSGTVTGNSMELTRERVVSSGEKVPKDEPLRQSLVLKRLVR